MATLFYSTKCAHCARLFQENPQIKDSFNLQNIDQAPQVPAFLRVVPTLVVQDRQQNKSQVYEGTDVFRVVQESVREVEPYALSCSNLTNKGFSFIDTDHPVYSEQQNYAPF